MDKSGDGELTRVEVIRAYRLDEQACARLQKRAHARRRGEPPQPRLPSAVLARHTRRKCKPSAAEAAARNTSSAQSSSTWPVSGVWEVEASAASSDCACLLATTSR